MRFPGPYESVDYTGFLLDGGGNEIPGTIFAGATPAAGNEIDPFDLPPTGTIELAERTVFRGFRFVKGYTDCCGSGWQWEWVDGDRPLVGQLQATGNQPPVADAGPPRVGTPGSTVYFDARTSDDPDPDGFVARYDWDFGDSMTLPDGGPVVTHVYSGGGTWNVTVTVADNFGVEDSDSTTATIGAGSTPPTADTGGGYTGTAGEALNFEGTASDPEGGALVYDWDFGDGGTAFDAGPTPIHTYARAGLYVVTLLVSDETGETTTDWNWVGIYLPSNQAPTADAGPPVVGNLGIAVTFDGSGSVDPDGLPLTYSWDFGDGDFDSVERPSKTYGATGDYTVVLTVRDAQGDLQDTDTTTASIGPSPVLPVADAGGPFAGFAGVPITFTSTNSTDPDGSIELYEWDFGGPDNVLTGQSVEYTYPESFAPGGYTVSLTVTDNDGQKDTDYTSAQLADAGDEPPTADAGPAVLGKVGEPITFNGSGSVDPDGSIVSYSWDFGDGGDASSENPTYTYAVAGDYVVTLTVLDDGGASDTDDTTASIDANNVPPVSDAGGPYTGAVGELISFNGGGSSDPDNMGVRVFVTSGTFDGNLGGYAGADSICTNAAAAAGFSGDWTAWLSGADADAIDRIALGAPYQLLNGAIIADDLADLTDGSLDAAINLDENLATVDDSVWTATETDGSFGGSGHCVNWTTNSNANTGQLGDSGDLNERWTDVGGGNSCDAAHRLYCFSNQQIVRYDWNFGDGPDAMDAGPTPSHTYLAAGTYDVSLTVYDADGDSNQAWTTAAIDSVNVPPVADAGGPYGGKVDVAVDFDGSGSSDPDGSIVQYDWDFGDGNTGTGATPANTYASTGVYDVVLTVTDDASGTANSATRAVIGDGLNLPPTADAGGPYFGDEGVPVAFDGSASDDAEPGAIAQFDWDFGDDNTGTGATPANTYAAAGMYPVTLTVTDGGGSTDTTTTVAAIGQDNQPPNADAGGPYSGAAQGGAVFFDGTGSSDPDGSIVQSEWNFGDGSDTANGLSTIHTYAASGVYTATLTVTDDEGDTDQSTATAFIGDGAKLPPIADAGGNVLSTPRSDLVYVGEAGRVVTFDGTGSDDADGDITAYEWIFGDDQTESGSLADHTYLAGGLYRVTLQVTDDDGLTASDNTLALIGGLSLVPKADIGGPYTGRVGVPIAFDGRASDDPDGTIDRYDWTFGDGITANDGGATPSNTYTASGRYLVELTVTDDTGETHTDVTTVTIGIGNVPPVADAGPVVTGTAGVAITFNGTASDDPDGSPVASYAWNFGDGNTGTGPNPTHSYAAAGMYYVTLTVTDNDDAVSSDVTLVDVSAASVSVDTKTEGGGAFGVFEMLLLAFAAGLRAAVRAWRAGSRQVAATIALTGILLIAPLQSGAADLGWYGALGVGSSDADFSSGDFVSGMAAGGHTVTNISSDDSDTGYKVYGGVTWGEYFVGELGYVDLGEATVNFDATTSAPDQLLSDASNLLPVLGDGVALAAIGRYPFGDRFSVFGKVGAYFWEADADLNVTGDVTGSGSPDDEGTDLLYGFGGEIYFPDVLDGLLGVRLEWERFELDDDDVDLVSVSLLFRFGNM